MASFLVAGSDAAVLDDEETTPFGESWLFLRDLMRTDAVGTDISYATRDIGFTGTDTDS